MSVELTKVLEVHDSFALYLAQAALDEAGIPYIVSGAESGYEAGFSGASGIGMTPLWTCDARIHVLPECEAEARAVLEPLHTPVTLSNEEEGRSGLSHLTFEEPWAGWPLAGLCEAGGETSPMDSFATCFDHLADPRASNARHRLTDILLIAFCAVLCGAEDDQDIEEFGLAKEDYFRQFLSLPHGIPSHDTFARLFRHLDPAPFQACFLTFMQRFVENLEGVVAIDGKTLRRSYDRATEQSPLHLVSAWAADQRLVLGQVAVDGKSNEITAVPQLLEMLSLKGTIVTADAMHCQRGVAEQVTAEKGDYVLALKANQGTLHDDVRHLLDESPSLGVSTHTEVDKGHGRIETRTSVVSQEITWLQQEHAWPGLQAIGKVVRTREIRQERTTETAYYLLSTPLSAERFGQVVRQHWAIENSLHWVLDVTMNEDKTRVRKDHGPANWALLRRMALNVVRLETSKGSLKGKRKRAGWNHDYLTKLLTLFALPQMR